MVQRSAPNLGLGVTYRLFFMSTSIGDDSHLQCLDYLSRLASSHDIEHVAPLAAIARPLTVPK